VTDQYIILCPACIDGLTRCVGMMTLDVSLPSTSRQGFLSTCDAASSISAATSFGLET
jgi:hypothetical protein